MLPKNCFLLKAYDINKATSLNDSKTNECSICNKKNHKTKECLYLKNFDEKIKEYKAKTLESQVVSTPKGKPKQTFEPVQTAVTKGLNKNSAPRDVQVTDVPPATRLPRGYGQPTCHRLPHVYEEPKRSSKPKVNRHPHGFQHLTNNDQTSVGPSVDIQALANGQLQLLNLVQKLVQTTDHSSQLKAEISKNPSKANLALDTHQN